jgi:tetratricopeptide (TPR) repeat protein
MRLLLVLALAAQATAARADDDPVKARALFQAGTRQYNVGEFREALEKFKAAYLAKADASFLFNMGQCYRQLGDPEGAARQYRAYLREWPSAPNREEVMRFIGDAEKEIARRAAERPPTGVMPQQPHEQPVQPPPPKVEPPPIVVAQPPPPRPAEHPGRRGLWIGLGVGAGVLVVAAIAVGLALGLSGASPPATSLGDYRVLP